MDDGDDIMHSDIEDDFDADREETNEAHDDGANVETKLEDMNDEAMHDKLKEKNHGNA